MRTAAVSFYPVDLVTLKRHLYAKNLCVPCPRFSRFCRTSRKSACRSRHRASGKHWFLTVAGSPYFLEMKNYLSTTRNWEIAANQPQQKFAYRAASRNYPATVIANPWIAIHTHRALRCMYIAASLIHCRCAQAMALAMAARACGLFFQQLLPVSSAPSASTSSTSALASACTSTSPS